MTVTSPQDLYYDPYDFEIDADPYPVWKRMRDEAPLYWNEKYEFFALSRWADVEAAMLDWDTYRSGRGSILEMIRANVEIPSGVILMEDPPVHTGHRSLLSRVFTPKKMLALEPQVRAFCAEVLDPLVGAGRLRLHRGPGQVHAHARHRHAARHPRAGPGGDPRANSTTSLRLEEGTEPESDYDAVESAQVFSDYITWRAEHPSDDLMTELINAEFEDETGTTRTLGARRDPHLRRTVGRGGQRDDGAAHRLHRGGPRPPSRPAPRAGGGSRRSSPTPSRSSCATRRRRPCRPATSSTTSSSTARRCRREASWSSSTARPTGTSATTPTGTASTSTATSVGTSPSATASTSASGAALARLEGRIALDEVLRRFPDWEVDYDKARRAHASTVRGWETLPVRTS